MDCDSTTRMIVFGVELRGNDDRMHAHRRTLLPKATSAKVECDQVQQDLLSRQCSTALNPKQSCLKCFYLDCTA